MKTSVPLPSWGIVQRHIVKDRQDIVLLQVRQQCGTLGQIPALQVENMAIMLAVIRNDWQGQLACFLKIRKRFPVCIPGCYAVICNAIRHFELAPQIGRLQFTG